MKIFSEQIQKMNTLIFVFTLSMPHILIQIIQEFCCWYLVSIDEPQNNQMDRQAKWGLIALCDSNFLFKYIKMKKKNGRWINND